MQLFVFVVARAMILAGAIGVITPLASGSRRAQPHPHPVRRRRDVVALEAHFLAAVQVIVYAGAIVVLFLFVIMLLGVDKAEDLRIEPFKLQRQLAAVVGVGVVGLIVFAAISVARQHRRRSSRHRATPSRPSTPRPRQQHPQAGRDLFSDHVLAFELTSVLLVIAVVGTVLLARRAAKGLAGDADQ